MGYGMDMLSILEYLGITLFLKVIKFIWTKRAAYKLHQKENHGYKRLIQHNYSKTTSEAEDLSTPT